MKSKPLWCKLYRLYRSLRSFLPEEKLENGKMEKWKIHLYCERFRFD